MNKDATHPQPEQGQREDEENIVVRKQHGEHPGESYLKSHQAERYEKNGSQQKQGCLSIDGAVFFHKGMFPVEWVTSKVVLIIPDIPGGGSMITLAERGFEEVIWGGAQTFRHRVRGLPNFSMSGGTLIHLCFEPPSGPMQA